ncbi:phytoene desaturase family protein [Clostridium tarantellae]|uniref:NAD(P)-binding protein n=1 Tax=Clostridium tarantellae TaxID=39493 RepID=A0A6I1MKI9_9CLOT|nr:NAD(P)/FAD-dependent oxidoreductase [Clostridium tarantellae]MPQ42958.1 NAD(P)-binding protein [Clostridium tarantellae]
MDFDVIVIGSGLGGLTAASRLAILGYNVGVFEQHFIPGGYATNFKRKNYNFDVSLHGIGGLEKGGSVYNILSACGVMQKIKPLKNKEAYSVKFNKDIYDIPNNKDEYKEFLISKFPLEKIKIEKLFNAIGRFSNGFNRFILEQDKSIFNVMHKDVLLFIKWSGKTTYEVIKEYIDNDDFIKLFTANWSYYGLPPKELSALYFFIPWISYHVHGKYYIQGGAQALTNAFVEVIKNNNGLVYLKSMVQKILTDGEKVNGIRLNNGDEFKAKWIISNVNPINTYKMLPKDFLSNSEMDKINNSKIGCTLSQLYLGLDCNPKDIGIEKEEIFFLGKVSPQEDYELALKNNYEEAGFLLTNYNAMDSTLNDDKNGVITMTYIDNYDYWSKNKEDYLKQKENVTARMIKRLGKYYKGISKHIVIAELGTPRTMEKYTKNPLGAVYGYAQYVDQAGKHRLKKETSVKNLSLVSAWTNPGGGYEGVMSGGIVEAQRISKHLEKN